MSTSANKSYAVSMLEDVILLDIDGVVSGWDSYTFNLDIASPGTKRIVLRIRDIAALAQNNANNHTTSTVQASDPANTKTEDVKVETSEQKCNIKVEEDNVSLLSDSIDCVVSPCHTLTKRCNNPDPNPMDPYAPWRHVVRPFDASKLPTEVAKRKAFQERSDSKRRRLVL
ncbi:hypothetical protein K503DRAFT_805244 [Rhizopogon vinicolor AM-OR11-026]|uniref:Uncharacterized protein n=1 Tax=Rhizopogon vinicolor AM-OR11-026 TaxID=1314800 RepID=A0A1B7MII3_9AGAM|nr:hypothetical protein K503DRAFT_805244 [Rhizopogon vinicolor AM-OR11-026]